MEKIKRTITPHKGGRSARFPEARITPEALAQLVSICEKYHLTVGDWATCTIGEQHRQLAGGNPLPLSGYLMRENFRVIDAEE